MNHELDNRKKTLRFRLADSVEWLYFVLEDFMEGETQSVSGNENAQRLLTACKTLRQLESDIEQLELLLLGANDDNQ